MRLSVRRSLPALLLLGATAGLLSCGDNGLGPNGEQLVAVGDNDFDPATKTIKAGETVLWQWKGSAVHNVTWADASNTAPSPDQSSGTYTRTFAIGGTFTYYCTIHGTPTSGMHGTVIVQFQ
jgi:plastocyanin